VTEKLNGSGKVFKGQDFVVDVEYDYRIQRKFKENRDASEQRHNS
jgi:ribosomal protein S24E